MAKLSVVIPVYNEAGNIAPLHAELTSVLSKFGEPYEIIYVNDASSDGSLAELSSLAHATVITLRRRYGQSTALLAGFEAAAGELIISMDGDGQNDPADIPRLLNALTHDVDVVAGWRKKRNDRSGVILLTNIGRALRRFLINDQVHDTGCTLRVYRSEAAKSIPLAGEMHRYILALLRWRGFRITEIIVNDRAREHGKSKYSYGKAFRGFIDLIYIWFLFKYSDRPLHLFGYLSLTSGALGVISLIFTINDRFHGLHVNHDGWFFLSFFFLIAAIIFFSFGIVIDLLMRTYLNTTNAKQYYILSTIENS